MADSDHEREIAEDAILGYLQNHDEIADSQLCAPEANLNHDNIANAIKSLTGHNHDNVANPLKKPNLNAKGAPCEHGCLHPLLKVCGSVKGKFVRSGFEEMRTNNYVESSFWNFDALFQPQQHPAFDSHDTFFLEVPSTTKELPEDYVERVKRIHESGGHQSRGYGYEWKREEAEKNVLRTHTTAVSSRMLYKLAQDCKHKPFAPKKYFSISETKQLIEHIWQSFNK